jgi:hypothetical protein
MVGMSQGLAPKRANRRVDAVLEQLFAPRVAAGLAQSVRFRR